MIFIGIVCVVFILDYFAKQQAEKELSDIEVKKVANGKVILHKFYNSGIAFGLLKDKEIITVMASALAMGATLFAFLQMLFKKGRWLTKLGYALIIGGGLNNLYERVMKGHVTDYFSFNVKWEKLKRLVFNISDMFILVGAFFVLLGKIFGNKDK